MRQLLVTVPCDRESFVIEALQTVCRLSNIARTTDGYSTSFTAYIQETVRFLESSARALTLTKQESGIVLNELDKVGCGTAYGKICMTNVALLKPLPNFKERYLATLVEKATWRIKGRMAVEEIYTSVVAGTELTFDYLAFIAVAGTIAAIGLATNNAVMIVASMLVSPLMGPILAFSFGTNVQDWYLVGKGLLAEAIGVSFTFCIGFVVGLIVAGWEAVADEYHWPTDEMRSRGKPSSLVVGVFFAIPSGAGVALSTTQGGANALVGVAIAASLLPPVVNSGMNLAYAAAGAPKHGLDTSYFYQIAGFSFALWAVNVVSIYLVCVLLFWVKRVGKVRKQLSKYRDLPMLEPLVGAPKVEQSDRRSSHEGSSGGGANPSARGGSRGGSGKGLKGPGVSGSVGKSNTSFLGRMLKRRAKSSSAAMPPAVPVTAMAGGVQTAPSAPEPLEAPKLWHTVRQHVEVGHIKLRVPGEPGYGKELGGVPEAGESAYGKEVGEVAEETSSGSDPANKV